MANISFYQDIGQQLLAEISMYPGVLQQQLIRLHPEQPKKVKHILVYLEAQGRIKISKRGKVYPINYQEAAGQTPIAPAIWVLLDFLPKVTYHSCSIFPVAVVFFVRDQEYHIVCVPAGNEALVTTALMQQQNHSAKQILLIDTVEQIPKLNLPGVIGYCTVDATGCVQYYQHKTRAPK
ncbi:MAG: hypothetical protein IJY91_04475 [Oscillospiraceae bacterium]|nr:hypothetical protein [Oscillospiraceae bacterium]